MDYRVFYEQAEKLVDRMSPLVTDISSVPDLAAAAGVSLSPNGRHWGEQAACRSADPAEFEFVRGNEEEYHNKPKPHVIKEQRTRQLNAARLHYCGRYPVLVQCLIDDMPDNQHGVYDNIRAGMGSKSRRMLYRRLADQVTRAAFLKRAVGE